MTTEHALARRTYEVHGIPVSVRTHEPAVLEAMDLRLGGFRSGAEAQGGVQLEFLAAARPPPAPEGEGRPVYDTPHGTLYYHPADDALWGALAGVTLRCEPGRGVAVLSAERLTGRALYLATHPLATISLMELLERRGLFSLHAGCVASPDGAGILLAGPSGAGKSTLALALARAGMSFLSDDVVFLAGRGSAHVLGFADAVGLTEGTAARFPDLRTALAEPPAEGFPKCLRRIEELVDAAPATACTPRALVFPEVAPERESAIRPLDGKEALLRLVPDVLLTEPAATQSHLQAIADLLARVRCYALTSGVDLERAVELARATL